MRIAKGGIDPVTIVPESLPLASHPLWKKNDLLHERFSGRQHYYGLVTDRWIHVRVSPLLTLALGKASLTVGTTAIM
jgi:hypothetical protein